MEKEKFKILHLACDEKFINAANYTFEKAFPGSNRFIIPQSRFNKKLTYLKDHENFDYRSYSNGLSLAKEIARESESYDIVIMHALYEFNSTVFLLSRVKERFVGIIWGAELYSKENFSKDALLGPITANLSFSESKVSIIDNLKNIARRLVYTNRNTIPGATNKVAMKLHYFAGHERDASSEFVNKKLVSDQAKIIPFTYYPLEYIMKGLDDLTAKGPDILVGNSSAKTNNHLEAFTLLEEFDLANRKIIVPLSYPDKEFANFIKGEGERMFGKLFFPLMDFMPIKEYNILLSSCGITIMNHFRAQAFGNIIAMLWLGSKVYLTETNPKFASFKKLGLYIFSIESDLKPENKDALDNLRTDQVEHNRRILRKEFGEESVIARLREGVYQYFG